MAVLLTGAPKIELIPDGPKANGYADPFHNKHDYMMKVLEDLMPRIAAREKNSPKGNLLASAEDLISRFNGRKTLDKLFTDGYIDGVYAKLDEKGGRRRKTRKPKRKTRSTRRR